MKKTCFVILTTTLLLLAQQGFSQNYDFALLSQKLPEKLPTYTPDSVDKKSATVYAFMDKTTEYIFDEKGEGVNQYFVTHTLKYINDDKSVEDNNKIYVSTNSSQELLYIQTRVVVNGKIAYSANEKDFIEVEEDGKKYNMIALKSVAKGCLIETLIGYKLDAELYGEDGFQSDYPVREGRFTLITPEQLKFNTKVYNSNAPVTTLDSLYNARRFSFIQFKNIPAVDGEEKYSLGNANKLRVEYVYHQHMVSGKKYLKWPEMGRILFERMNRDYDKNAKDLDKILATIKVKQYKTTAEKVFAIENYIKTNIASEPQAPESEGFAQVMKVKYTYPFKINQMYTQLFRKAGIACELVLTCEKPYKRFDPTFDSWTYLKSMIFYFPEINQFMDPDATLYRLGKINTDYLGQQALFVKSVLIGETLSASASVRTIPGNKGDQTKDYERYTTTLSADLSSLSIQYEREMNGYAEQGFKGLCYALPEDKKKEIMEGFVKGLATDAKLTNLEILNSDISVYENSSKPLIIKAQLEAPHYVESAGEMKAIVKVGELIGQQMEMYQATPRTNPVDIPFAHNYERTIVVMIPDGYTCKGLEKLNINHTFTNASGAPSFGFTSSYTLEKNKLTILCNEYYNDLAYPIDQFTNYKTVINDAADFNKIAILVEKN